MILNYAQKTPRVLLALAVALGLAATMAFLPVRADDTGPKQTADAKTAPAVQAMLAWLKVIDDGKYEDSWNNSSKMLKSQVTAEQFIAGLKMARAPLGACKSRALAVAQSLDAVPSPTGGTPIKGTFVIAQFRTTMEKSGAMLETVTFKKESDGIWRAAGYFITAR